MKKIIQFLNKEHILTVATSNNNTPYCATCFYVFDEKEISLIFASSKDTTHIKYALKNPKISGTIHNSEKNVLRIQGVQFIGEFKEAAKYQYKLYFKKFPYAKILNPNIWQIKLSWIKFTDNSREFKHKTIWKR